MRVSVTVLFSSLLTGCTGLAPSNKKPVKLVQFTDHRYFHPFDMALSCLKGQLRSDVSFSVGAISTRPVKM